MSKATRQPKATDEIRGLLESYIRFQEQIDLAEERLAVLEISIGDPSPPNLTGETSSSGNGDSKTERKILKKMELEEKIGNMYAEENRRREEIEGMIELMDKPREQTVIEMHYLDGEKWWPITVALFGKEPDYDEHEQRYLKRTFKIHGSALQSLARIYNAQNGRV